MFVWPGLARRIPGRRTQNAPDLSGLRTGRKSEKLDKQIGQLELRRNLEALTRQRAKSLSRRYGSSSANKPARNRSRAVASRN